MDFSFVVVWLTQHVFRKHFILQVMKKSRTSSSSGTTTAEPEVEEVNVRRSKRIASKSSNISQRESSQGSLPAVTWAPTGDISGAEDKPSIAIRSGLHHSSSFSPDALIQRVTRSSDLSGLWGLLPEEVCLNFKGTYCTTDNTFKYLC